MKLSIADYIKELVEKLEQLARENERLKLELEQLRQSNQGKG